MSWLPFLEAYHIAYKKSSGDNVEIPCCLCSDDHSTNLGLSTVSSGWHCWRNDAHRGFNPVPLIQALLHIDREKAILIAKQYFATYTGERRGREPKPESAREWVEKPPEFLPFRFSHKFEKPFMRYLTKRGFAADQLIRRFNLHYCLEGPFESRLIIPIIEDKHWYSWVGRTIDPNEKIRYKAASQKIAKSIPVNHLLDIDNLTGGEMLVICEGSFDAMAITSAMMAATHGTCLFGKEITDVQIGMIKKLGVIYRRIVIGLDADAEDKGMKITNNLRWYIPNIEMISPDGKDWAEMTPQEIRECLRA